MYISFFFFFFAVVSTVVGIISNALVVCMIVIYPFNYKYI